ncbi:AI-2E family transporter [Candidatus Pacearchaeota archaeon]|nr:AI-2E family transporter [Candidatus Pacearchaeota archaeon]
MNFGEKEVRRLSTIILVLILLVLSFLLIRPILMSIIAGLIVAYIFMPLHKKIHKHIENKTLAASIVSLIIIAVIIGLLWVMLPLILREISEVFIASQGFNMENFLRTLFPSVSDQFIFQTSKTLSNIVESATTTARSELLKLVLNIPVITLHLFIVAFTFFFAMRDSDQLVSFAKGLSPLNESKEKIIVKHFKDMTDSLIYGQIIVGLVQGILAGIGFVVFGVKNILVLTVLAIFFSILPFLGPFIVWVPISIYMFTVKPTGIALIFLFYNLFIVSLIDNFLRPYIVSRKTDVSPAIILIGMLGGLFVFGIMGLIIGPLILAYLITLLESFKDKSIYALFD